MPSLPFFTALQSGIDQVTDKIDEFFPNDPIAKQAKEGIVKTASGAKTYLSKFDLFDKNGDINTDYGVFNAVKDGFRLGEDIGKLKETINFKLEGFPDARHQGSVIIGDVLVKSIRSGDEELQERVTPHEHTREDGRKFADDAQKEPRVITVTGYFGNIYNAPGGGPADMDRRRAVERIVEMMEKKEIIDIITNIPPGIGKEFIVTDFNARHMGSAATEKDAYQVTITVKKEEFSRVLRLEGLPEAPLAGEPSKIGMNPVSGELPSAPTTDVGEKPPGEEKKGFLSNLMDKAKGVFDKAKSVYEKIKNNPITGPILGAAEKFARNNLPGADLVFDALSGNIGFDTLVNTALSAIPGANQIKNVLSNPIVKGVVSQVVKVGDIDIAQQIRPIETLPIDARMRNEFRATPTSFKGNPQGLFHKAATAPASLTPEERVIYREMRFESSFQESLAIFTGTVFHEMAVELPELQDISMVVGSWYGVPRNILRDWS